MCYFKAKVEVNTLITSHFACSRSGAIIYLCLLVAGTFPSIFHRSNFEHAALIATADLKPWSVSAVVIFQFRVNIQSSIKIINQGSRDEVLIMKMKC